jgi:primosomal protein N''
MSPPAFSQIYYTPKHGSWLDIAEVELSALVSQCLGERRISSIEALNKAIAAWEVKRKTAQKGVDWHFTTTEARIKLKRLYPIIL